MLVHKTYQPKAAEIKREWHLVDAEGEVLGRLASRVAQLLVGKGKKNYVPHLDMGDYVVVVNAMVVRTTGKKEEQKIYWRHSGYPGGLKSITLKEQREKDAAKVVEWAVYNMLPKNRLRDRRMRRLKVFVGSEYPYGEKFKGQSSNVKTTSQAFSSKGQNQKS